MSDAVRQLRSTVLIVGAGGSGLTTALELQRGGVDFAIIDAAATPNTESRAAGMQPRTLELLDLHGLSDELIAGGASTIKFTTQYRNGKMVGRMPVGLSRSRYRSPPAIPQARTEGVLRARLASKGVDVRWQHKLVALEQDGIRVVARLDTPDGPVDFTADWLIGTDGARSTVRKLTGLEFEGISYPEAMGLMDAQLDWDLPPDELRTYRLGGPQQFALVPFGGKTYRIQYDHRPAELAGIPPTVEEMQAMFDRFTGEKGVVSNPIWSSAFNIHRRQVVTYRSGRVFLAGDAAHIHTPQGAQGLNTGIQDGLNLAWKMSLVVNGLVDERLLDSYEDERKPIATEVLELTETLARRPELLLNTNIPEQVLADRFAQLLVNYRHGPFSQPPRAADAPIAGDRLPDVEWQGQSIYRALRHGRIVVALFGEEAQTVAAAEQLRGFAGVIEVWRRPSDDALAQALRLTTGAVVIRPDAYLGLVVDGEVTSAADGAAQWLRSALRLKQAGPRSELRQSA